MNLAGQDINIFTQIGFVVLVGLASKNAILIVEFAKVKRESGESRRLATLEACRLRLRPIIMTSCAFILGAAPLMVAHGAGAEMRRTLGTAVFSGMLGVTLFGILLTPVFFSTIDWLGGTRLFASRLVRRAGEFALAVLSLRLVRRLAAAVPGRPRPDLTTSRTSPARARDPRVRPSVFSNFFINRPIFASVVSIVVTLAGGIALFTLPIAQYPGDRAADGRSVGVVSRSQRPGHGRYRGRADRAAGQRRREHAVHVVAMHQRRRVLR